MKRRLWEQDNLHCSIIGTCLSMKELQKIVRRTKINVDSNISEFELHGTIVSLAARPGPVSKAVEKMLNQKYSTVLRRFSKYKDESSLVAAWNEALSQGDIPGPYWALLCHPLSTERSRSKAFGEVHMLSHLVGASNRADIKSLSSLQKKMNDMTEKMSKIRAIYKKRIREMAEGNRQKHGLIREMAKQLVHLKNISKQSATQQLQQENYDLQKTIGQQALQLVEVETDNMELRKKMLEKEEALDQLKEISIQQKAEINFLEQELAAIMHPALEADCQAGGGCSKAGTSECPGPLLCGKRILYVGGRTNLIQHYRSLVEKHGAKFIHHDGGLEDAKSKLPKLLNTVDSVICPVDCVSHNACLLVKDACRQRVKPLKFIRSSGLSTLARSLDELGEAANEGTLFS